jgi:nicotinate-nucleotide pyrophosphorylase (carboxylating)
MCPMSPDDYLPLVQLALREDLGDRGDITTNAIFAGEISRATLVSKDSGVLAGADVFRAVFAEVDSELSAEFHYSDGDHLKPGDTVAFLNGRVASILTGERVALNFLSFLSGIATSARRFADAAAAGGRAIILDTRKTLPGYRTLSKYAVRAGGAQNHRNGLYDMVLIKDNHIDFAGSITRAVERVRSKWAEEFRIEVECRTLEDISEALACGVDMVMLDNMDEQLVREAVSQKMGASGVDFEASGNVTLETAGAFSKAGVDFISVGSLTHSVKGFDFSLKTEVRS